jgi:hypothetical protein
MQPHKLMHERKAYASALLRSALGTLDPVN